jgi:beta-galactosidase
MEIRNKQDFATLAWIRGEWELKVSGKRVANGKLPALKTAPQKEEKINRPKSIAWQPRHFKARFSM